MSYTKAIIVGNLTRDPELKSVGSGSQVASFTVACNRRYKTASGEQREEAAFIDCEAWGKTGENIARYFGKGKQILVEGEIKQDTWEDRETGAKRSKLKIGVSSFSFVGPSDGQREDRPRAQAPASPVIDHDDIPF